MKTLPVNLNLRGLPLLMVGGGKLAAEKLEKLLPHAPRITLVSPELSPAVQALADSGAITYVRDTYHPRFLKGQRLVFAATGDREVHRQIRRDTLESGILLNTVDTPELCDFIFPAVVQGEHFSVAVCSGGLAAGFSRRLREELETFVRAEDDIVTVLEKVRAVLKRRHGSFEARKRRLLEILDEMERAGE